MPATTLDMLTRAAPITGTANADDRSVEIAFASAAPVKRYSWDDGYYLEELTITKDAIDVSRMDTGMSLLDTHDQYSIDSRLGSVVPGSFRIAGGKALCRVKFSRHQRADQLFQDILDGHTIPVSVGYRVLETTRTEGRGDALPTIIATRWMPLEVSLVPVPADANTHTRSEKENHMPQTLENERQEQHRQAPNNIINERTRISELRGIARLANVEEAELVRAIDEGTSAAVFRERALEHMAAKQNAAPTFPHSVMPEGRYGGLTRQQAMSDALLVRVNAAHKPNDASREFVGLTLPELARRSLEAHGVSSHGMSAGEVVQRALHTTSDFAHVISGVGQTVLGAAYASVPSGVKAIARKSTARDFKLKTTARLSGFSDLEKVNEHGEFKRGTFSEGAEGYRISTFGKVFGMTRQMLVNDDLGAFADVSRELGLSAARLEADILANLVKSNPKLSDGKAIFHADHANMVASGTALTEANLSIARLAMGKQTGLAGELIDVVPKFLVVSLDQQTTAEKLLAQIQPASSNDVNPFAGKLQLVVDRRLDASPWYLAADPDLTPSLEYSYLEGSEGPRFFTREGFDIDGVETKVSVDFGAGWTDYRGWYCNTGV
ncbi:prohead protease/major capsid protein fusion protein [Rhizobium puerariae]|uniref:Prohead protease/major capsid protein fusion protein n=1 Tax=Rhizobium puerariae TaxID=1585791 RepID=A0ABV6AK40_9HYPH